MKKIMLVGLVALGVSGCQDVKHIAKSLKTSTVGARRTVTLYSHDGAKIREWKGRMKLENVGSTARFIADGKVVHISGTFVVQED